MKVYVNIYSGNEINIIVNIDIYYKKNYQLNTTLLLC